MQHADYRLPPPVKDGVMRFGPDAADLDTQRAAYEPYPVPAERTASLSTSQTESLTPMTEIDGVVYFRAPPTSGAASATASPAAARPATGLNLPAPVPTQAQRPSDNRIVDPSQHPIDIPLD